MPTYAEYQRFVGDRPKEAGAAAPAGKLNPTSPDILGPYYRAGAPVRGDGVLVPDDYDPAAQAVIITGRVTGTDGAAVAGAVLDVWQADAEGVYDNAGYRFRGKVTTDGDGRYAVTTVRPGDYKIADDPPDFRCAHVHVKLTADGFKPLTTQLYFADDPYNRTDHWYDPARVVRAFPGGGLFDFVLAPAAHPASELAADLDTGEKPS